MVFGGVQTTKKKEPVYISFERGGVCKEVPPSIGTKCIQYHRNSTSQVQLDQQIKPLSTSEWNRIWMIDALPRFTDEEF